MATALIQSARFRTGLGVWLVVYTGLHAWVVKNAGLSWAQAFYDGIITNALLGLMIVIVTVTLQFYVPQQARYSYVLGLCAVLTTIWLTVSRLLVALVVKGDVGYELILSQSIPVRAAAGFLVLTCTALISILWYTVQDAQETEARKAEADRLWRDSELNNLRQQLQPHFLFNSLNSINSLIGTQPTEARAMVQRLSDFLRGTLKKDATEWTSVEDELAHLELYLAIEKVRFGHRLSTEIRNTAGNARLPVMILQPVVENAIKFGLYDTTEAVTITVLASTQDAVLTIRITNPYDAETNSPRKGAGFGLDAVARRLYLLFARNDLLTTEQHKNLFTTTIKIPQA